MKISNMFGLYSITNKKLKLKFLKPFILKYISDNDRNDWFIFAFKIITSYFKAWLLVRRYKPFLRQKVIDFSKPIMTLNQFQLIFHKKNYFYFLIKIDLISELIVLKI